MLFHSYALRLRGKGWSYSLLPLLFEYLTYNVGKDRCKDGTVIDYNLSKRGDKHSIRQLKMYFTVTVNLNAYPWNKIHGNLPVIRIFRVDILCIFNTFHACARAHVFDPQTDKTKLYNCLSQTDTLFVVV